MAINSGREKIILFLVDKLEGLPCIKTVVRMKQTYSQLSQFAVTQLPVAAVVGHLPIPKEKVSARVKVETDLIVSELAIDIFVYFQEKENPDGKLSNILDDVWAKVYEDEGMDDLIISMRVTVSEEPEFWDPYVAFKVIVTVKYKHTTGGI